MSGSKNSWKVLVPPDYNTFESREASASGTSGSALHFRPSAAAFTPKISSLNIGSLQLAEPQNLDSPNHSLSSHHYHLLNSTFMPPETPPMPQSPFQISGNPQESAALFVAKTRQGLPTDTINKVDAIPQQDTRRNEMAHGRVNSDLISTRSGLGFDQIVRPRSRSDGPWNPPSITDYNNQPQANMELATPLARRSIDELLSYQSQERRSRFENRRTSLTIVSEKSPVMFERDLSEDRGSVGGIRLPTEISYHHTSDQRSNLMRSLPAIDTRNHFVTPTKRNGRSRSSGRRMAPGSAESVARTRAMSSYFDSGSTSNRSSPTPYKPKRQLQSSKNDLPIPQGNASYLAQLIKNNVPIDITAPAMQQNYQDPHFMQPFMPMHPTKNVAQFPEMSRSQNSDSVMMKWAAEGGPTLEQVFEQVPLIDLFRSTAYKVARKAVAYGVLRIIDIPYGTTRNEIVAFLGHNAPLVTYPAQTSYYSIHIIMDRPTAKSMDCFVEYEREEHAKMAVARFNDQSKMGKRPRVGDRQVRVQLSSQEALMKQLFPKAKCVVWKGQEPIITLPMDTHNSGFRGFITSEEMVMTVRWAENPARSNYTHKHLQRVYESMITLLVKYPWWMVHDITLNERDLIFNALVRLTRTLVNQVDAANQAYIVSTLNIALLTELVHVGLATPGFSESQRIELIDAASGMIHPPVFVSPLAAPYWPFEVLRKKDEAGEKLLEYYASLLKKASTPSEPSSLAERSIYYATNAYQGPFGKFKVDWNKYVGDRKGALTIADAANYEWIVLEQTLKSLFEHDVYMN